MTRTMRTANDDASVDTTRVAPGRPFVVVAIAEAVRTDRQSGRARARARARARGAVTGVSGGGADADLGGACCPGSP
jgi:hypothetical protein